MCTTTPRTTRPTRTIRQRVYVGGNRSSDEMAHLWLQVLPKSDPAGEATRAWCCRKRWARHEVEKAPSSFESHYNLAEMLQAAGALDEAIVQFQAASIRPTDAVANNALGGALLAKGDLDGAVQRFSSAMQRNPITSTRTTTWASALASQGNFQRGSRAVWRCRPAESGGCECAGEPGNRAGAAGRLTEAKSHYEAALRIDPHESVGAREPAAD